MCEAGLKDIARGHGWHGTGTTIASADYGISAHYEGAIRNFRDSTPGDVSTKRSNIDIVARLVRNVAPADLGAELGVLTPKRMVSWASGYRGRRVDGYTCTTACEVAGVVDELWPTAGVPRGEMFWLQVRGRCLVKSPYVAADATTLWNIGDWLVAVTAATSGATTAGRISLQDLATAATGVALGAQIQNRIGQALSASTSANTNSDKLVDLRLY
jgi:hypothetical protein